MRIRTLGGDPAGVVPIRITTQGTVPTTVTITLTITDTILTRIRMVTHITRSPPNFS